MMYSCSITCTLTKPNSSPQEPSDLGSCETYVWQRRHNVHTSHAYILLLYSKRHIFNSLEVLEWTELVGGLGLGVLCFFLLYYCFNILRYSPF